MPDAFKPLRDAPPEHHHAGWQAPTPNLDCPPVAEAGLALQAPLS